MISAGFDGCEEVNDDLPIEDESDIVEATIASLRARGEWITDAATDAALDPWARQTSMRRDTAPAAAPLDRFDPVAVRNVVAIGCRNTDASLDGVLSRYLRQLYENQADAEMVAEAIAAGFQKGGQAATVAVRRVRCGRWKIAISLPFEEDWE
jgi:hypothetical protein